MEILTGIRVNSSETARKAAIQWWECGIEKVMITLGAEGVYLI
jgi:sugar/nucleoside kinase (ribokinase family)